MVALLSSGVGGNVIKTIFPRYTEIFLWHYALVVIIFVIIIILTLYWGDNVKEEDIENVARMGEMRNEYPFLVGESQGKRPFGRPKRGCVKKK
jgi:hypothetical protein